MNLLWGNLHHLQRLTSLVDKRTNNKTMLSTLKNNAAAGYKGPVKIDLLKGAYLLSSFSKLFPPYIVTISYISLILLYINVLQVFVDTICNRPLWIDLRSLESLT